MKRVKLVIWAIILAFVILVIIQNWTYLLAQNQFQINLYFTQYQTPPLANGIILLGIFLLGLLLAYIGGLAERLRTRKATKRLNAAIAAKDGELSAAKKELERLIPPSAGPAAGPSAGPAAGPPAGSQTEPGSGPLVEPTTESPAGLGSGLEAETSMPIAETQADEAAPEFPATEEKPADPA